METTNQPVAYSAGYSLTASTTSTHRITLEHRKYITAIECHIPAQSGGPAWIRLTLERGMNRMTLAEGYLSAKGVVQGSGQLPLNVENANILLEYTNTTSSAIIVDVMVWASDAIDEKEQPGWFYHRLTWDDAPMITGVTADPAAGADPAAVTVPAGKRWLLLGVNASLVTDGTAANRYPILTVKLDGTNVQLYSGQATAQTASTTRAHSWVPGIVAFAIGSATPGFVNALPSNGVEINAGGIFAIATTGLVAADDWTVERYAYKELPL